MNGKMDGRELANIERMGWVPVTLAHAADDVWHFLLKLRTGDIFYFSSCVIEESGTWATLYSDGDYSIEGDTSIPILNLNAELDSECFVHRANRGIEIRIQDIVWIAEASS